MFIETSKLLQKLNEGIKVKGFLSISSPVPGSIILRFECRIKDQCKSYSKEFHRLHDYDAKREEYEINSFIAQTNDKLRKTEVEAQ